MESEQFCNDYIISLLKTEKEISLEFTKKDGSIRRMLCTLNESVIPTEKKPKSNPSYEEGTEKQEASSISSKTTCSVFDLEKQAWRSFRWDSLKSFEFVIE